MSSSRNRSCFSFRGRAGRQIFWLTWMASMGAMLVSIMISGTLYPMGPVFAVPGELLMLATIIIVCWVMLAVQVRRWHDLDKSGWMVLLNFIPLVGALISIAFLGFAPGKAEPNRFDVADPVQAAGVPPPVIAAAGAAPGAPSASRPATPRKSRKWVLFAVLFLLVVAGGAVGGMALFIAGGIVPVRAWFGDTEACLTLAQRYRDGWNGVQDITLAVKWYEKAAEKGSGRAMYDLGILHYYGIGMAEDSTTARRLFQDAADAGYTPALVMLGVLLEDQTPDNNEARLLWEKAARLEDPWAESLLGSAYLSRYSRTDNPDDIIAALYWMESARRHGVEPVGGLLQHAWANLAPGIVEEVSDAVFKHLAEGPPAIAGDEEPVETEDITAQPGETEGITAEPGETEGITGEPGETEDITGEPVETEDANRVPGEVEVMQSQMEDGPETTDGDNASAKGESMNNKGKP